MADQTSSAQPLSLEGEVVEILEKSGQRRAKIVLEPSTVVDISAGGITDVHLGDRVVISGSITIERVRTKQDDRSSDSR